VLVFAVTILKKATNYSYFLINDFKTEFPESVQNCDAPKKKNKRSFIERTLPRPNLQRLSLSICVCMFAPCTVCCL
jgi:hypothetical protein